MNNWKHGYFAENGYTFGFYDETSPARLAWAASIKGYKTNLEEFRYLDLGCGQGLNLILLAALYPKSEFIGVDFMPEHIAHAKFLAKSAEINNIQFIEGDFLEIVKDCQALGEFDYVIAHGITTWISEEVRNALFKISMQVLKPGGLMYNGYNTYPGWLHASPFQNLVLQLQKRNNGKEALESAKVLFKKINDANTATKTGLPGLQERIEKMESHNMAYLVQEYNNQFWSPVYANQMLEIANKHKLSFIGSATIIENFKTNYPKDIQNLIQSTSDLTTQETIRDLSIFQSFRRDLYVKGGLKFWGGEHAEYLLNTRFIQKKWCSLPRNGESFTLQMGNIKIDGGRDHYENLLNTFGSEGMALKDAMALLKNKINLPDIVHNTSFLLQGGWLGLAGNYESTKEAYNLNKSLASAALGGASYNYLCAPRIASAISVDPLDLMIIAIRNKDDKPDEIAKKLMQSMIKINKRFPDGQNTIEDQNTMLVKAVAFVDNYLKQRDKQYQSIGAI